MSLPREPDEKLIGFCSAPWTDCISYADGALKACDRNFASFGNWQENGLKKTWESDAFQEFRRSIREGRYPDQDCASCHNNGTQRTATSSLIGAYAIHYNFLMKFLGREKDDHIPELADLYPLLSLNTRSPESDRVFPLFFAFLDRLREEHREACESNPELRNAIVKLRVVGESLEDYLNGALKPRRVATFRQSQLQAKCTARCVMCAGKFTGEIVDGPTMDTKYEDEAFAEREDITDFWCNGAEYLFYKDWKKVALLLKQEGVSMRVSTNGILLNEPTIDFLLERKLLGFLTLSLDAATKETMESIRVRVNYEKTLQRIRYLLRRATEAGQNFEFTAAFVMMKRNLHELPAFVRLVKELMPPDCGPQVTVLCQPLENFSIDGYRQFVHQEHHSLLGEAELRKLFEEVHRAQQETGLDVRFYNQKLPDFVAAGMPFPKYFPRQMDVDIFMANIKAGAPIWPENALDIDRLIRQSAYGRDRFCADLTAFVRSYCEQNAVIAGTLREFPAFAADLERLLPEYMDTLTIKFEKQALPAKCDGTALSVRKYAFRPFCVGDFVYSFVGESAGKIDRIQANLVLLQDGSIVSTAGLHHVDSDVPPPAHPSSLRGLAVLQLGRMVLRVHWLKESLLGGIRSPLLWKLSVAYRSLLASFGVRMFPDVGRIR